MVGRKKSSTSKSTGTKQQTLLDLFPRKSASAPLPHQNVPLVSQPIPTLPTTTTDNVLITIDTPSESPPLSRTAGTVPLTSSEPEIIDITHSSHIPPTPSSKPTSSRSDKAPSNLPSKKEPQKLSLSHSNRPPSRGPNRPLDPVVIDLTLRSSPPLPKASDTNFGSQSKIDGPVLPTAPVAQSSRQTYSIFTTKPKKLSVPASPAKPSTATKEYDAPFPAKDNQHVRGPQTIFPTFTAYPKRSSEKRPEVPMEPFRVLIDPSESCVQRTLTRRPASSFWEKEQCIHNIPSDHKRDHPAIARLAAAVTSPPDASSSSEKLWSDRWRPQRADGVLGNEAHAVYLRDWLRALEVRFDSSASLDGNGPEGARGVKRPQVMRSVAKRLFFRRRCARRD
ncbi:hypothetical protein B0H12DRAFT_19405 [Mycena haematopus]|nr:hypothetical protein B0H12DRAFT_19405 [Mycena haematopus]